VSHSFEQTLVRTVLERAEFHPWRVQSVGLLGLWLDDQREYRLHVWDPEGAIGEPPIHDHAVDFTSTVVVGEIVNTRYVEDPSGPVYLRERHSPGNEDDRRADAVRLVGASATLRAGDSYRQLAHELHGSAQAPGTVTVVRFEGALDDPGELTTCRRLGTPWVSGKARPATPDEVRRVAATALALFETATGCERRRATRRR